MIDALFDGSSIFARAWYAICKTGSEPTETEAAEALQATLLSVTTLLNSNNERLGQRVDRTLFAWDLNVPDKGRAPKPGRFYSTRETVKECLTQFFGTVHASREKTEADDIVATVANQSTAGRVYIVSGDKDLLQLQGGHIRYYCLNTKAVLSTPFICEKWGIKHPNQVPIALAVIGDPVDGFGGIPKWGKVKARKLFNRVSETMDFQEALEVIEEQIPADLLGIFHECLQKTILDRELPGLPAPSPLCFAPLNEAAATGLPKFNSAYSDLVYVYSPKQDEWKKSAPTDY